MCLRQSEEHDLPQVFFTAHDRDPAANQALSYL